jgi:hypothetical protein
MEQASFAAVVRSTGKRLELLREALQSLTFQWPPVTAVVVAHGDDSTRDRVNSVCESVPGLNFAVLQVKEKERKRGYPLNAGIKFALEHDPSFDYLFFLDDDDVVYPFFTRILHDAFLCTGADLVYAASNRRENGESPKEGYYPKTLYHLLSENFITSNSYAIRLFSLRLSGVLVDDNLDYTEDWDFLVSLLSDGLRFEPCFQYLSEFRITSDGNLQTKLNPEIWKRDSLRIRRKINSRRFNIPGGQLVSVVENLSPRLRLGPDTRTDQADLQALRDRLLSAAIDGTHLDGLTRQIEAHNALIERQRRIISEREEEIVRNGHAIESLKTRASSLENSLSWRITAPLRRCLDIVLSLTGKKEMEKQ